ncbi:MAG: PIN domain-containing protein [Gemmatimonadaceae bacterium]
MKVAYVDTSCVIAVMFGGPGAPALARRLRSFDELVSANLLEAELRAAFARERIPVSGSLPLPISWILPDRPLTDEIARVLAAGYVRGADCWHLATALYLAEEPEAISFVTVDERQKSVAKALGFQN